MALKNQRVEKSKKEKKPIQRNKDEETMVSRKDRTGKIAGGLVRSGGGRGLKQPGRWEGGDGV